MKNGDLLNELYEGKKYLEVVFGGKDITPFIYMIRLLGRDKEPDCYISSINANLYFRTVKGKARGKYKSYAIMLDNVKRRATQVLGKDAYFKEINIKTLKEGESLPIF